MCMYVCITLASAYRAGGRRGSRISRPGGSGRRLFWGGIECLKGRVGLPAGCVGVMWS